MNGAQARAIDRAYLPLAKELDLPMVDWPRAPDSATDWQNLVDQTRRDEIVSEVEEASPEVLITLGDDPLRRFAQFYETGSRLAAYGQTKEAYGRLHEATIGRCRLHLLPLAHPRQAASLGRSSPKWTSLHRNWVACHASGLLGNTPQTDPTQPTSGVQVR